ncbi:hypothetical protein J2Y49_001210 [Azospirillum sp. BE72]|nr:hypothetical protein [Azospirillum sp. BE72]
MTTAHLERSGYAPQRTGPSVNPPKCRLCGAPADRYTA